MGWRKKLRRAKKLHRPSLKDWECDGLCEEFPDFVRSLKPFDACVLLPDSKYGAHAAPVLPVSLDARNVTPEHFWERYEAKEIPCVIHGIPLGYDGAQHTEEWPAVRKWTLKALEKSSDLRERAFKCGEDDDGHSIKVKLKYFLRYLERNRDDSPLYIFDSSFENDKRAKSLLRDYRVPTYFRDDLFRLVSESRRPPYRWVLVGPERSGSCVHVDPLATNAWNTLLSGKKRWVLFPPEVPKYIVKGRGLVRSDEDDEASHYFMFILPRIKRKALDNRHHPDYKNFACYEFTQNANETGTFCFISTE
jgi:histone arginine demethylase JMJD6